MITILKHMSNFKETPCHCSCYVMLTNNGNCRETSSFIKFFICNLVYSHENDLVRP